jgi:hypothetical protein
MKDLANEYGYRVTHRDFLEKDRLDDKLFQDIQKEIGILPFLYLNDGCGVDRKLEDYEYHNQNVRVGTIPYNKNDIEDRYINKISDYAHNHMYAKCFPYSNAARLRVGNLNAVVSIINNPSKDDLIYEINHPNIGFGDNVIDHYKAKGEKIRFGITTEYCTYGVETNYYFYQLAKCFGKLTPEVIKIRETDEYNQYRDIMIDAMKTNAIICEQKLIGIKWITQNPGRQWTSSINPIVADPREWYGEHYIPVLTGIPTDIEATLRLLRKKNINWSLIPDDIFDIILLNAFKNYADQAWNYIR